jgi:hypothetical protein
MASAAPRALQSEQVQDQRSDARRSGRRDVPPEFNVSDLLSHPHLPLLLEFVPKTQETIHERQIEAVLWSIREFVHRFSVPLESRPFRGFLSGADVRRELTQGRDREGGFETERSDSIVEVREPVVE